MVKVAINYSIMTGPAMIALREEVDKEITKYYDNIGE